MTSVPREKFDYLEAEPAADAPESDNPSGMYCSACRAVGCSHCSEPEWCGGMRLMQPQATTGVTDDQPSA